MRVSKIAKTLVAAGTSESKVLVCPSYVRNPQYTARAPLAADPNQQRRMYRQRAYVEGATLWAYSSPKFGNIQNPSSNGAIVDSDRQLPGATSASVGNDTWKQLPDKPVHGGTRNYGFFDGHVSSLSTNKHTTTMTTRKQPYGWFTSNQ